jgi:hypothetical protein
VELHCAYQASTRAQRRNSTVDLTNTERYSLEHGACCILVGVGGLRLGLLRVALAHDLELDLRV